MDAAAADEVAALILGPDRNDRSEVTDAEMDAGGTKRVRN
jgi:hypothetical protein